MSPQDNIHWRIMFPLVNVPLQKAHFPVATYMQISVEEAEEEEEEEEETEEEYHHIFGFLAYVPHYDNWIIVWDVPPWLVTREITLYCTCLVLIPLSYSVLKQWDSD